MSNKDPRLERVGVSGYNKPKRTPNHPTKSHVVVAKCEDGSIKTIRFGQQGVSRAGKNPLKLLKKKLDASHLKLVMQRTLQRQVFCRIF